MSWSGREDESSRGDTVGTRAVRTRTGTWFEGVRGIPRDDVGARVQATAFYQRSAQKKNVAHLHENSCEHQIA